MSELRIATEKDIWNYSKFPLKMSIRTGKKYREAYDREFPEDASDVAIEMWCAGRKLSVEEGGVGEFQHYKNIMQILYPYLVEEWNHWLDMQLEMLCGPSGTYTMLGGGGIGKSYILGTLFSRIWQACKPEKRLVMIINTTQKTQRDRAWKYVMKCSQDFPWMPGNGIISSDGGDPRLSIYRYISDPQNPDKLKLVTIPGVGIISQTVKAGNSARATADLKGYHEQEVMYIVEEANHNKRSRLERARANWITNPNHKIILTGNPEISDDADSGGREDSLYHFSTPIHGWGAIEWGKDRSWDNKFGGKSYHFDPQDSPAIREPERFKVSTWLPTQAYMDGAAKNLGGNQSQLYKQQIRGIYDHESLPFNLFNPGMLSRFEVSRPARFIGMNRQRWAAFDPAYSGSDEAFLKIAESGLTEEGRVEIDFLGEATNFRFLISANSGKEPSFQMMDWVRELLTEWKVPYENFIMDAQLIGIGLGDIFSTYLSKKINKVIVTGPPSERVMDLGDSYTARDRCVNKATEMWLALQQLVICNQVRGLDKSICDQLCDMPAEKLGGKIKVMMKKDFRANFGYSPDRAETVLFIIDMIRERGLKHGFDDPDKFVDTNISGIFQNQGIGQYITDMSVKSYMQSGSNRMIDSPDGVDTLKQQLLSLYSKGGGFRSI